MTLRLCASAAPLTVTIARPTGLMPSSLTVRPDKLLVAWADGRVPPATHAATRSRRPSVGLLIAFT
jgi:hypothetical protein